MVALLHYKFKIDDCESIETFCSLNISPPLYKRELSLVIVLLDHHSRKQIGFSYLVRIIAYYC